MKGVNKAFAILGALALVAFVGFVSTFGYPLPSTPTDPFELSEPVHADSDGTHTAIIDQQSRRLLILDKDDRLDTIVSFDSVGHHIDAATDVCVDGDVIWLSGVKYQDDSDTIALERVAMYTVNGDYVTTVHDSKRGNTSQPSIKSLTSSKDGAIMGYEERDPDDPEASTVVFVALNDKEEREISRNRVTDRSIFDMSYCENTSSFVALSARGIINDDDDASQQIKGYENYLFTCIDFIDDGQLFASDDVSGNLYCIDDDGRPTLVGEGEGFCDIHINKSYLTACADGDNSIVIVNLDDASTRSVSDLTLTPSLAFSVWCAWASRIYLICFIVLCLIAKLVSAIRSGDHSGIVTFASAVVVTGTFVLGVAYTSYGTFTTARQTRENIIGSYAEYFYTTDYKLADGIKTLESRAALRESKLLEIAQKCYEQVEEQVGFLVRSSSAHGIGTYAIVYGQDEEGIYHLYDSAEEHIVGRSLASPEKLKAVEAAFESDDFDDTIKLGHTLRDSTMYNLVPVIDEANGSVVAVVEVGSKVRSFESALKTHLVERLIELLALVLVIYLGFTELHTCAMRLLSSRSVQHESPRDAIALLTRPISLAVIFLTSIDGVMTVLISKSLAEGMGTSTSSVLTAIPTALLGIGLAIGHFSYSVLGYRIGLRKLLIGGLACAGLIALFGIVAVATKSFWVYCGVKLLLGIPFGLLYSLGFSLPRHASTSDVRDSGAYDFKCVKTSAAALGMVLGGYAAQGLGFAWVYVLLALACLLVVIVSARLFSLGQEPLEQLPAKDSEDFQPATGLRTILPIVALVLLIMLPMTLSGGYKSFLFPLYSADAGLSTASINSLFVLAQLLLFVCMSGITQAQNRLGIWGVTPLAIAALGATFLLFALNTTFAWSTVVIFIIALLTEAAGTWKNLWVELLSIRGIPAGKATGMMWGTLSLLATAQPLILTALRARSDAFLSIVLGVICCVGALGFWVVSRKRVRHKKS